MIIKIASLINHSKKQNGRIMKAVDWIHLTQDRDQLWTPVNIVTKLQSAQHFERSFEIEIYKTGKYVLNFHREFLYVITVLPFYCIYEVSQKKRKHCYVIHMHKFAVCT